MSAESNFGELMDLVATIMFSTLIVSMTVVLITKSSGSMVGLEHDKTSSIAKGGITVEDVSRTGADLLMSLVITDSFTSYPKSIRINDSPIIDLDSNWMLGKFQNITEIYSTSGSYKLGLMLSWKIVSTEFVPNNGDPYIQYRLEA